MTTSEADANDFTGEKDTTKLKRKWKVNAGEMAPHGARQYAARLAGVSSLLARATKAQGRL
jgi:hypothetical protein